MSSTNRNEKVAAATAIAQERAREAVARVKPAAAQVKPLAKSTQDAAMRGLVRTRIWAAPRIEQTRIWAAPRIEHTGQVLQDSVAPKVADMLSGIAILVAAAATAAAAALRKRSSSSRTIPEAEADTTGEVPGAPQASADTDASRAGRTS